MSESNRLNSNVKTALRIILGAGIMGFLFHHMPGQELKDVLASSLRNWPWWIAGITATFLGLWVGSLRWHCILRTRGFQMKPLQTFRIFFIGQFFNAFFLGACGGDLVRAYYAAQAQPDRKTGAVLTVLVDRAIGLFIFIIFGCLMIAGRLRFFAGHAATRLPSILMGIFLLGALMALFVLFRQNLFERWKFFKYIEQNTRFGPLVRKAYDILFFYKRHKRLLLVTAILSLLNLVFLTLACYCFALSLNVQASLLDHLTLFPVITVITAVPLTPGALGIREGLFAEMFAAVGVASVRSVPLSLLVYLGGVVWSLFGGLLFLIQPSPDRMTLREELRQLSEGDDALMP